MPSDCPECVSGKHGNCDGSSWDNEADERAFCRCWLNGHNTLEAHNWVESNKPRHERLNGEWLK